MDNFSPSQKLYYRFLGQLYALTFWVRWRRFLDIRLQDWITWLSVAAILLTWMTEMAWSWRLLTLGWGGLIQVAFRTARRAGFNRFVPDQDDALPPATSIQPLPDNQRVGVRATGVFSLSQREDFVLLRQPAEYWRVPLGEHIVMVEQAPGRFLYQFFNAQTLQAVKNGWLIFGTQPQRALAISFLVTFGPEHNDSTLYYFVGGGQGTPPPRPRTIYFSFADEATHRLVWQSIIQDARQARLRTAVPD